HFFVEVVQRRKEDDENAALSRLKTDQLFRDIDERYLELDSVPQLIHDSEDSIEEEEEEEEDDDDDNDESNIKGGGVVIVDENGNSELERRVMQRAVELAVAERERQQELKMSRLAATLLAAVLEKIRFHFAPKIDRSRSVSVSGGSSDSSCSGLFSTVTASTDASEPGDVDPTWEEVEALEHMEATQSHSTPCWMVQYAHSITEDDLIKVGLNEHYLPLFQDVEGFFHIDLVLEPGYRWDIELARVLMEELYFETSDYYFWGGLMGFVCGMGPIEVVERSRGYVLSHLQEWSEVLPYIFGMGL
ncbi:MAG: hypothetical protein M1838_005451, partial [Thelocarpon superellum]